MRGLLAIIAALAAGCGRAGFDERTTYRDVVLEDAPLGYWRLADRDAVARDETGQLDGTYSGACLPGTPGALAGDPDAAVTFDGQSCQITLPDALNFAGSQPFTVEAWVWARSAVRYGHYFTRQTRDGASGLPVDGYALLQNTDGTYLERVVEGQIFAVPRRAIAATQFVHVVGVYDPPELRMYVDGELASTRTDARAMPTFGVGAMIGAHPTSAQFEGVLDEVAVYGSALATARIEVHRDLALNGPR